jgi:hypothetical protein|uniref:Uncharacterized protein n=1 Tax=uncultured Caudovirales phage TaxID=2100421 RepID=A0A6J5KZH5_9CAUD|nr:hypothetical protein UFOVP88_21 [uncultured Caudovirales phage]
MKLKPESVTAQDVPHIAISHKESTKEMLKEFIRQDTRMVRGRFRNYENPGQNAPIECLKYKDVPKFKKIMMDNQIYEIPLWVADHLNGKDRTATKIDCRTNSCAYPIHGFVMQHAGDLRPGMEASTQDGPSVLPTTGITQWKQRYGFEPLDFAL